MDTKTTVIQTQDIKETKEKNDPLRSITKPIVFIVAVFMTIATISVIFGYTTQTVGLSTFSMMISVFIITLIAIFLVFRKKEIIAGRLITFGFFLLAGGLTYHNGIISQTTITYFMLIIFSSLYFGRAFRWAILIIDLILPITFVFYRQELPYADIVQLTIALGIGLFTAAAILWNVIDHLQNLYNESIETNRKLIEEQKTREISEKKYGQLFSKMANGFLLLSPSFDENQKVIDFHIEEMNPALENILNINPSSYNGVSIKKISPNGWPKLFTKIESAKTGGQQEGIQIYNPDWKKHLDVSILQFGTNQIALLIHDMTDRIQMENELMDSQKRYEQVTQLTTDFLYIATIFADDEMTFNWVSDNLRTLFDQNGIPINVKFPLSKVIHPDDYDNLIESLKSFPEESDKRINEYRVYVNNITLWLRDHSFIMNKTSDDHSYQIFSACKDITLEKQYEYEMQQVINLSRNLQPITTLGKVYEIITKETLEIFNAKGISISVIDHENDDLYISTAAGLMKNDIGDRSKYKDSMSISLVENKQGRIINNIQDSDFVKKENLRKNYSHLMAAPILTDKQCLGIIWIGRDQPFYENDLSLFTTISNIAATTINRNLLFEETKLKAERLNALRNIDESITTNFNLDITLDIVIKQVMEQLKPTITNIYLYDELKQSLTRTATSETSRSYFLSVPDRLADFPAGQIVLQRKPLLIHDLSASESDSNSPTIFKFSQNYSSYYGFPLIAKGKIKGVMECLFAHPSFTDKEWFGFFETLAKQTAIAIEDAQLMEKLQRSNIELSLAYDATLEGWAKALELRDYETRGHSKRVTDLSVKLARNMGISGKLLTNIRYGALLHDIGKMGIPDNILLKPASLTKEEMGFVKKHPEFAYEMLVAVDFLRDSLDIPYYHHERWDGTGYPKGLSGENIPLAARIFAVIDVYDALISPRPYKEPWSKEKAREEIETQSGYHFDPDVVNHFLQIIN